MNILSTIVFFVLFITSLFFFLNCAAKPSIYNPPEIDKYTDPALNEIQQVLDLAVVQNNIPGIQMAIRLPDGEEFIFVSGTADGKRKKPITPDSLFQIASTTKMFNAAIVLILIEKKLLSLQDTLNEWYPQFPHADKITIQHLLSHTSGIPELMQDFSFLWGSSINPYKIWDKEEIVLRMAKKPLDFEPGTKYSYSNTNYVILGCILEKLTGRPFHLLLEEYIITPLVMHDTYLLPGKPLSGNQLVTGIDFEYMPMGPHWMNPDHTSWRSLAASAGGMVSSARDLVKWLSALLGGEVFKDEESLKLMTQMQRDINEDDNTIYTGYGMGMAEYTVNNRIWLGHRGAIMGYDSLPVFCPETGVIMVLLANFSRRNDALLFEVLAEVNEIILDKYID